MNADGAVLLAGCGDVGVRTGLALASVGCRVYGLRRSDMALPAPLQPLRADLTDPDSLRALPDDIRDVVFLPAPGRRDEAAYRGLFVDGLAHLLDALQRRVPLRRFVFVSSSAVYGEHGGAWVDEDSPCVPLAFNGRQLLDAEARLTGLTGPKGGVREQMPTPAQGGETAPQAARGSSSITQASMPSAALRP